MFIEKCRASIVALLMLGLSLALWVFLSTAKDGRHDRGLETSKPRRTSISSEPHVDERHQQIVPTPLGASRVTTSKAELVVVDEVTGQPLPRVRLFVGRANDIPIGVSDEAGLLRLEESEIAAAKQAFFAQLPPELGGRQLSGRIYHGEGKSEVVIPAFSRLVVEVADVREMLTDSSREGLLRCVSWPTPREAIDTETSATTGVNWDSLESLHEMRSVDSESGSSNIHVDYHSALRKTNASRKATLFVVSRKCSSRDQVSIDLPFEGEVVLDFYLSGVGLWRSTARMVAGRVSHGRVKVEDQPQLHLRVSDSQGRGISGARVSIVVRRELAPSEVPPPGIRCLFAPEGTDRRFVFRKTTGFTDTSGLIAASPTCRGCVFASASKAGFVANGKVVWKNGRLPPSGQLSLELQSASKATTSLVFCGDPVVSAKMITIVDLEPIAPLFQMDFGYFSTDDAGKLDFSCLRPGHKYAVQVQVDGALMHKEITYTPGMVIEIN